MINAAPLSTTATTTPKIATLVDKAMRYLSLGFIFLFPLLFLPTTANFYQPNKLALVVMVAVISLVLWAIKLLSLNRAEISFTPLTAPLLAMAAVTLLSSFIAAENPTDQLLGRGALIPAFIVWSVAASNLIINKRFINHALYALIASSTILSIIAVFQGLGFGLSNLLNASIGTTIPNDLSFSPAGTPLGMLSLTTPVAILTLMLAISKKDTLEKVVLFLLAAVLASGVIMTLIFSLPGKETAPSILPIRHGYAIALKTLENTRTLLLGFGPESFINAYTQNRPATLNLTNYWNVRFTTSSTELFQVVTTTGLLGTLVWIWLAVSAVKLARARSHRSASSTLTAVVVFLFLLLQLIIPGTFTLLFGFFAMLTIWMIQLITQHDQQVNTLNLTGPSGRHSVGHLSDGWWWGIQSKGSHPFMPIIYAGAFILIAGVSFYFTTKAYAAEVIFRQSLMAASQNQGVETYDLQRKAIVSLPTVSRYRRAYSATNLALANSLAGKEELTNEERQQVTQLIQQAIREAKAAVTLDRGNVLNWESLALVYRSLVGVAEDAPQWTIATYGQTIQVEPTNPQLRLQLGGVYFSLNQFDQAIRLFQQSIELKPNFANGYYNLSHAYRQKEELLPAFQALQQAVSLLDPSSADFVKASEELKQLEETVRAEAPEAVDPQAPAPESAQGELQTPPTAPTPNPTTAIQLDEDLGPGSVTGGTEAPTEATDAQPATTPSPAQQP